MDTRPLRMLSGSEIVARHNNVADCIFPEVGLKEVAPTGSWLEKKQVQTALESRKALVAAERINKLDTLSQAEWIDTLGLAKVTQLSGGHWQYLGHNVSGTKYLLPEEILYLMEMNCLLLKHNEVPVSLQKAYTLLLDNQMSLLQYKVYASLSRVGYKVFRHGRPNQKNTSEKNVIVMDFDYDRNSNLLAPKCVQSIDNNSLSIVTLMLPETSPNSTSYDKCTTLHKPGEVVAINCTANNDDPIKKTVESMDTSQLPNDVESTEKYILSVNPVASNDGDPNNEAEKISGPSQPLCNEECTKQSTVPVGPVISNGTDSNKKSTLSDNPVVFNVADSSMEPDSNKEAENISGLSQPSNKVESNKISEISSVDTVAFPDADSNMEPDSNKKAENLSCLSQPPKQVESTEISTPSIDLVALSDADSNMEPDLNKEAEKCLGLLELADKVESTEISSVDTVALIDADSNMKTDTNKEAENLSYLSQPPNQVESTEISSVDAVALNDADSNMETDTNKEDKHFSGPSQSPNQVKSTEIPTPVDPVATNHSESQLASQLNNKSSKESTLSVDIAKFSANLSEASKLSADLPQLLSNDANSTESTMADLLSSDINIESKESSDTFAQLSKDNNLNKEYIMSLDEPQLTNTSDDLAMDCSMPIDQPIETQTNGCIHYDNSGIQHLDTHATFSIDSEGVVRVIDNVVSSDVDILTVPGPASGTEKTDAGNKAKPHMNRTSQPSQPKPAQNPYKVKQWKIENRKIRSADPNSLQEIFKTIPDFHNKRIVTINVPHEKYLPRNIYLNNSSYVIDVNKLKSERRRKPTSKHSNEPRHRMIRNSTESDGTTQATQGHQIPSLQTYFGIPLWRPRYQMFQVPAYQRQPFQQMFFYRQTFPSHPSPNRPNGPQPNTRAPFQPPKRQRNSKTEHLNAIKHCAHRLKQFGSPPENCRDSLIGLVKRYNEIYNEQVQISMDYTIIETLEVIELEDDEVPTKKPKLSNEKFDLYLAEVKALANRLNSLERKNQPASRYRRAFSNLLKHFNDTFDADYYLNPKGELIDRQLVVLDSSSDSDVVATEDITPRKRKKRPADSCDNWSSKKKKVLPNPFSFAANIPSVNQPIHFTTVSNAKDLLKYFHRNWLPSEDDFGKAVLTSKADASYLSEDSEKLYEFMDDPGSFKSWVELKMSFYTKMAPIFAFEQDLNMHSRHLTMGSSRLKPILDYCFDEWTTSLEQLRIIKTNTDVAETRLRIDFDVYNRDVQNFRKTDPPKPHFRIVCVGESSPFPSSAEVRDLKSRHDDVMIVFAIVGVGSISYLQINPKELSVFVGND